MTTATPTAATVPAAATLTRIRLNRRSPAVRRDLDDAVNLHKTLMRLAPNALGPQARQQAGLLFRLDHQPAPTLLIQTAQPPDLTALPATYGTAQTRDLTPMFAALTPGLLVRYRITANASTRQPDREDHRLGGPRKRGKVIHLTGEQALTWWNRRATSAGLDLHTTDATRCAFRTRPGEPGPCHPLTRFDGIATITDPDSLIHALTTGIGRGKPYGAGLLTLAPA